MAKLQELDIKKFLTLCGGIGFILLSAAVFLNATGTSSVISNFEDKKKLKEMREECEQMVEKEYPSFYSQGLSQNTEAKFEEKTGDCYAFETSIGSGEYKSAHLNLFDVWADKEIASIYFGCKDDELSKCSRKSDFLRAFGKIYGYEEMNKWKDALPSWEEEYGKAP